MTTEGGPAVSRKNWKQAAAAYGLNIPEADFEKVVPALDAMEAAFRPLARSIPHEVEPAVIFRVPEDAE